MQGMEGELSPAGLYRDNMCSEFCQEAAVASGHICVHASERRTERLINLYLMNSYGQLTRQVSICCFLILPVEKHTTHTPYLTHLTGNMRAMRTQLNCCLSIKFFNEVSTVWHWLMCYNHINLEGIGRDCWWRLTDVQFLHAKYHTPISLQMLPFEHAETVHWQLFQFNSNIVSVWSWYFH